MEPGPAHSVALMMAILKQAHDPAEKETRWALKTDGICGEHRRRHGHRRRHNHQCGHRRNRCHVVELELVSDC